MNEDIKAEVRNLRKIFTELDFFYQIPDYQRPYSWGIDNLSDLIDDLANAFTHNSQEKYFCGSLVLVKNKEDTRYDVIDGQQRLTTFSILFCVLRDFYSDELTLKSTDLINLAIQNKYNEEEKKLKFLTEVSYQSNFQKVIDGTGFKDNKNPDIKNIKNKFLKNAYYLREFIKDQMNDQDEKFSLKKFIEWIFENVVLTTIICPNEDTAIKIFNVLNNRGMPLSSVDILKSNLMTSLNDQEDKKLFKADWDKTKTRIEYSDLNFDDLFTFYLYYTITTNPKTALHKALLEQFKNKKSLEIIRDIEGFAKHYISVMGAEDKYIHSLKYLKHQIYWKSILTTAKYVGYDQFDDLKKMIFAYYYQNWIGGGIATRIKPTSFNILKKVKSKDPIESIKPLIKDNLDKHNTTQSYEENIKGSSVFDQNWAKPVLLFLEYKSKDDSNQNFIPLDNKTHIEHILPQTTNDQHGWNGIFTEELKKEYGDCLGNLTLLSGKKNTQAKNFSFKRKKETYMKGNGVATSFELTRQIFEKDQWTPKEIEERKKDLIEKLDGEVNIF